MTTQHKTIVAFHIGRGGHYHNPGYLTFIGERKISDFTDDLFLRFDNEWQVSKQIGDRTRLRELFEKATNDCDQTAIDRLNSLSLNLGERGYQTATGYPVGLTEDEEKSGIGVINIDNDYDTTYTTYLEDCNENELRAILRNARNFEAVPLLEAFGFEHVAVFDAFDMLEDMIDRQNESNDLSNFDIEEITREEYEELQDMEESGVKTASINGKYYKKL